MSKKANEKRQQRADRAAEKAAILAASQMTTEQLLESIEQDPKSLISARAVSNWVFSLVHEKKILEGLKGGVTPEAMAFFRNIFQAGYAAGMNHESSYQSMVKILKDNDEPEVSEPAQ